MGEFFNDLGEYGKVEARLFENDNHNKKHGLDL